MSRTLKRLKVRLGRPKPIVACPWKKGRKTRRLNQIRRLIERDSEAEGQARRMLAAQSTREERLAIADDVISNTESVEQTQEQVDKLHRIYTQLSQNRD